MTTRHTKYLFIVMIVVIIVRPVNALTTVVPDQQSNTDRWQRYTAKGEEISVMLPELPAMSTYENFEKAAGGRKERIMAAYSEGAVFVVYSFHTRPKGQRLKQFIQEMLNSYLPSGTLRFQRSINVNGIEGAQYSLTGGEVGGSVQFYETARHSYAVTAIGLEDTHPHVTRFFSSVQFDKQPVGEQVKDGPGPAIGTLDVSKPLTRKDVTRKPVVVMKPQPSYTGLADKDRTTGTVVLRVVFSASGRVTDIQTVAPLPNGLTESAIEAARRIRFIPAVKDGQFVSMWMQLEYNFWR